MNPRSEEESTDHAARMPGMAGTEVCETPVPVRFPGYRFYGKNPARLQTPHLTCHPSSASKLTAEKERKAELSG